MKPVLELKYKKEIFSFCLLKDWCAIRSTFFVPASGYCDNKFILAVKSHDISKQPF